MPSPFPGMDPYLEDPGVWPDFHDALAAEIRRALNGTLPEPYYAQLGVREEIGIAAQEGWMQIIPDVSVHRSPGRDWEGGAVAVADEPRIEISEFQEIALDQPKVNFVEIRDARKGHEIITLIEILSPSNKRPGSDSVRYREKREGVLASTTSLVEIDLLRAGDRSLFGSEIAEQMRMQEKQAQYFVLISRAWREGRFQLFPVALTGLLPVIPIPLRQEDTEPPLDLQYVFRRTYDGGPYRRRIDYKSPPAIPLPESLLAWAREAVATGR